MNLLAISNLYPRPDKPHAGMFNAQLFREMAALLAAEPGTHALHHITLVPEWRLWRWPAIRRWTSPYAAGHPVEYRPVFYVPALGRNWSAATYAWSLKDLAPRVAAADAVFASWLYPDGVVAVQLAQVTGKPAWMMALGTDTQHLEDPLRRRQIVTACGRAAGVVCVGAHLAGRLVRAGVQCERIHVVPNGVDAEVFRYRPAEAVRRELIDTPLRDDPVGASLLSRRSVLAKGDATPAGADQRRPYRTDSSQDAGARIVLYVGNLVSVKAPDLLLAAFAQLSKKHSEPLRLVILGAGPLAGGLRTQATQLSVADRVVFAGSVTHERVALWMNAADALCLCSRSEGMPNVILEALASGLPVVATDVGACREMVEGESAARLVPPDDATALANALGELLDQRPDRMALATRHGRRSWQDQAREIVKLMKD